MLQSYSGPITFFRQSTGSIDAPGDIAVVGLPMDLAVSNRPGARFGPRAIRVASAQLAWGECWPWGFDPFERLSVRDLGDVDFPYGDLAAFRRNATAMYRKLIAQGVRPLGLGGDHHVTAVALDAIAEDTKKPMALLQFDAHTDTTEGPDFQHGTMFHHAIQRGLLRPEAIVRIGVRTAHKSDGGLTIGAPETAKADPDAIARRVLDKLEGHAVYLTFDIDCLDPAFAPGTGTPVPGGLSSLCMLEILRALGREWPNRVDTSLVGADLVEVSPPYDHAEITAIAACQILHELCCLLCVTAQNVKPQCA